VDGHVRGGEKQPQKGKSRTNCSWGGFGQEKGGMMATALEAGNGKNKIENPHVEEGETGVQRIEVGNGNNNWSIVREQGNNQGRYRSAEPHFVEKASGKHVEVIDTYFLPRVQCRRERGGPRRGKRTRNSKGSKPASEPRLEEARRGGERTREKKIGGNRRHQKKGKSIGRGLGANTTGLYVTT